jgi:hypothetical protein
MIVGNESLRFCPERYYRMGRVSTSVASSILSCQLWNDANATLCVIDTIIGLILIYIVPRMGGEYHQSIFHIGDHGIDYRLRATLNLAQTLV